MVEVLDRSYNYNSGELEQFLILTDSGQPRTVQASPENVLLYDPENELPFDNGLQSFFDGETALVLQESDPIVMIAPTSNIHCYILRVGDNTVETTRSDSEEVLRGLKKAVIDTDVSRLCDLFERIMSQQVRRDIINVLITSFDNPSRLSHTNRGWLVDDFYLVNWNASMYTLHNDPDEPDYERHGNTIQETGGSREFVKLNIRRDIPSKSFCIDGDEYELSEREMLFLMKIKWLLNRREKHSDLVFWKWNDKFASVDEITGEPL